MDPHSTQKQTKRSLIRVGWEILDYCTCRGWDRRSLGLAFANGREVGSPWNIDRGPIIRTEWAGQAQLAEVDGRVKQW